MHRRPPAPRRRAIRSRGVRRARSTAAVARNAPAHATEDRRKPSGVLARGREPVEKPLERRDRARTQRDESRAAERTVAHVRPGVRHAAGSAADGSRARRSRRRRPHRARRRASTKSSTAAASSIGRSEAEISDRRVRRRSRRCRRAGCLGSRRRRSRTSSQPRERRMAECVPGRDDDDAVDARATRATRRSFAARARALPIATNALFGASGIVRRDLVARSAGKHDCRHRQPSSARSGATYGVATAGSSRAPAARAAPCVREERERTRAGAGQQGARSGAASPRAACARATAGYARSTTGSKSLTSARRRRRSRARCKASTARSDALALRGRSRRRRRRARRRAAGKPQPSRLLTGGAATTTHHGGSAPTAVTRSPVASTSAPVPTRKNGTSEPSERASASQSRTASGEPEVAAHRRAQHRRRVARTAAQPGRRSGFAWQPRRAPVRDRAAASAATIELPAPTRASSLTNAEPLGRRDRDLVVAARSAPSGCARHDIRHRGAPALRGSG